MRLESHYYEVLSCFLAVNTFDMSVTCFFIGANIFKNFWYMHEKMNFYIASFYEDFWGENTNWLIPLNSYLILLYQNNKQKMFIPLKKGLKVFTKLVDMLSEVSGQHVRSSRNDCPGMSERLSGAAGQNYKSIFIMLKWIEH